jgi:putative DNA primase/helicase
MSVEVLQDSTDLGELADTIAAPSSIAMGRPDREVHTVEWSLQPLLALNQGATPRELEASLSEFAERWFELNAVQRELAHELAVKRLKDLGHSRPNRLVDSVLSNLPSDNRLTVDSKVLGLADPEPWSEPVDGAALLDEITAAIAGFISAAPEVYQTVALWVLYSHCFDCFDISPLLAITSPLKRCGKSTLLDLITTMVPRPLSTSNITISALFRTVEKYRPVLLIDEADSFFRESDELRGVLNSGHRKGAAYVIRTEGSAHEPKRFKTWCPKAVALIGAMADTLEDRAVKVQLKRKSATEKKRRLRIDLLKTEVEHLCRRSARWAIDMTQDLRDADPEIPWEITNDRARDNWRPLVAIADAVGGRWPWLAREAALFAEGHAPSSESPATILLGDLKGMFGELGHKVESAEVVGYLIALEERPWAEWGKQHKPLTTHGLARLLKPFGITPDKWREGNRDCRGYHRKDFQEAFDSYVPEVIDIPASIEGGATATSATGFIIKNLEEDQTATVAKSVGSETSGKSLTIKGVALVATQPSLFGDDHSTLGHRDHQDDCRRTEDGSLGFRKLSLRRPSNRNSAETKVGDFGSGEVEIL